MCVVLYLVFQITTIGSELFASLPHFVFPLMVTLTFPAQLIVNRTQDGLRSHVSPCVYTAYLVLISIIGTFTLSGLPGKPCSQVFVPLGCCFEYAAVEQGST